MAGSQISTSVSIIDSLFGFQAVSLTAFDTASAPSIAAGSKVEIAGAFFSFTSDETINATSWSAISTGDTAYITLTPAGTAGTQTVTAAWTSTAPTWSDSKQAYYASAASNIRVIGGCVKAGTTGSEYIYKWLYKQRDPYWLYKGLGKTQDAIFTALASWVPNLYDTLPCSGYYKDSSVNFGNIDRLYRGSTTSTTIYYIKNSGVAGAAVVASSASTVTDIEILSNFQVHNA